MVAPEFPPRVGGMEAIAGKTAEFLAGEGHTVCVLTAAGTSVPPRYAGFSVEGVLTRDFSDGLRKIHAAVRRLGSDVIVAMNAGFAPVTTSSSRSLPPVVVFTAGNDVYGAWHGPRLPLRFLFWRLPHGRPGSLGARLRRYDQQRRVSLILRGLARCERIVCNSAYTRARLHELGVPYDRLHVLVGGVDVKLFSPLPGEGASQRSPGAPPVLGTGGHLKPIKGFDIALRMLPLLSGAATGALLKIAGTGPEEPRLRALASNLGLADRVEFLGQVTSDAMPDFYRSLDLYLQPSVEIRHQETGMIQAESMGLSLCEAQSCGIPVIASRCGGIPEVVADGVCGRLVPPGDSQGLADAVMGCLASSAGLSRMREAGRRAAVERFSWGAVGRSTVRHLEEARARMPELASHNRL